MEDRKEDNDSKTESEGEREQEREKGWGGERERARKGGGSESLLCIRQVTGGVRSSCGTHTHTQSEDTCVIPPHPPAAGGQWLD